MHRRWFWLAGLLLGLALLVGTIPAQHVAAAARASFGGELVSRPMAPAAQARHQDSTCAGQPPDAAENARETETSQDATAVGDDTGNEGDTGNDEAGNDEADTDKVQCGDQSQIGDSAPAAIGNARQHRQDACSRGNHSGHGPKNTARGAAHSRSGGARQGATCRKPRTSATGAKAGKAPTHGDANGSDTETTGETGTRGGDEAADGIDCAQQGENQGENASC